MFLLSYCSVFLQAVGFHEPLQPVEYFSTCQAYFHFMVYLKVVLKNPLWLRGRKQSWLQGTDGMTHWDSATSVLERESGRMYLSEVNFCKPGLIASLHRASTISNMGGSASLLSILTQGENQTPTFEFSILLRHTNKEVNRSSAILNGWRSPETLHGVTALRESQFQRCKQSSPSL